MTEADGATAPGLGTFENRPAIRLAASGSAGRPCGGQDQGAMPLGHGQGIPLAIGSQSHVPPIHYVRVGEAARCQLKEGCGRRHVGRQARKSPKRHHPPSRRPCEQWPRRGRSVITTPPANNSCACGRCRGRYRVAIRPRAPPRAVVHARASKAGVGTPGPPWSATWSDGASGALPVSRAPKWFASHPDTTEGEAPLGLVIPSGSAARARSLARRSGSRWQAIPSEIIEGPSQ